jgi:hypothetical protein
MMETSDQVQDGGREEDQDLPPLLAPLPSPPLITLGEVQYILEHVRIDKLEDWRREHNLEPDRVAFLGRPGWRVTADGGRLLGR